MVGQHGPEAEERGGRDAGPKLRNVAFQVGADELLAPDEAAVFGAGEEAVRETAADPEFGVLRGREFEDVEGAEFHVGDSSREGFGLLQKVVGSGAEQQEPARSLAPAAATVDEAAEDGEELGHALDFVENDELVLVAGEVKLGLCQLVAVAGGLEVEVEAVVAGAELEGERGLAGLAGSEEGNGGKLVETGLGGMPESTW